MPKKPVYEELEKRIQELEKEIFFLKASQKERGGSENTLKDLPESNYEAIFISEDGICVDQNENAEKMFGYTVDEAVGRHGSEWIVPEHREIIKKNMQSQSSAPYEVTARHKNGSTFPCEIQSWNTTFLNRRFRITALRDVTGRNQAEAALRRQQKKISLNNKIASVFLTALSDEIYTKVLDVIIETTESGLGYFGYIDKEGNFCCPAMKLSLWDKSKKPDQSVVFQKNVWRGIWGQSLKEMKTFSANGGLHLPEGHVWVDCVMAVPIINRGKLIGQFVVGNKPGGYDENDKELLKSAADQTAPILNGLLEKEYRKIERIALEERIQQAQKMESIGNLAGGIAHDFNNILFPILGMSELLLEDLPSGSVEYENVREIYEAGKRGSELVQQILAFSRQSEHKVIPVRVQSVLKEVLKLTRSTIPSNIEINREIQSDCGLVLADPTQLHQVGMNLITNAFHAVEEKNGKIFVELKEVMLSADDLVNTTLKPGKYALLSVADNGTGMPSDVMDKLFEPYFTTKEQGKGTGLGLAVVYGILKTHKGDIKVYSKVGEGSVFKIYLPLMKKKAEPVFADPLPELATGDERILLVDDEESVVRLEKQMLQRLGYRVTEVTSSIDAVRAFNATPDAFDLVFSDMTMPNITGDELARKLRAVRADIPIIICTGFSERINQEKADALGVNGVLMKPVVMYDLAKKVRKVLDDSGMKNL